MKLIYSRSICRNSQTHRIYSDTFEHITSVPAVTHAPNAEKPSQRRRDLSSIRTSIRRWNRFSAKFVSKPTRSSRTCAVISECTPIVACKSSATSADKASAQWRRSPSTSASVTQPELAEISRAINNLNSNRSKSHQQWQRRPIHTWCFAITRRSSRQDSRRFPACREFSHRAPRKHLTFLYCFQSTTSSCHLWTLVTERHRLN